MTRPNTSRPWLHQAVLRLAATAVVSRLLAHTAYRLDRPILRLTGNRYSLTNLLSGLPIVTLTTIGAKSGQARTAPLVGLVDGDKVVLIGSNYGRTFHPAWYHNLRANPRAQVSIRGRSRSYLAHEATPAEREEYWRRAVSLYAGFEAYRQRTGGRQIPIMVLIPE